jgi:hypothetical protein
MRTALLLALVLTACNQNSPSGGDPSGPIVTGQEPLHDNSQDVLETGKAGDLPKPGIGLRFVGKWAANEKSCQSDFWHFTETTLRTPAGYSCSLDRVTEVSGGYDVQATCTAQGPPAADTLKLRFAESAKALLLQSKALGDTALIFCGRDV